MAKQFRCPQCQKVYNLPETFAGGPVKCTCGKITKVAALKPESMASVRLEADDGMSGFLSDMASYEDEAPMIDMPKPPPPKQRRQPRPSPSDMSISAGMNSGAPLPYESYEPRPKRRPRGRSAGGSDASRSGILPAFANQTTKPSYAGGFLRGATAPLGIT